MSGKRTIAGLLAGLLVAAASPPASAQKTEISLQQALRQGKVEVEVKSLGGATGNRVRVYVKRKVPGELRISVTPGTVLLTAEKDLQNITLGKLKGEFISETRYRPGSVMVLVDNRRHSYLVESFCLDYHKKAPKRGHSLTLAINDQRAARILNAPKQLKASPWAFQLALWMDREGVSPQEVRRRFPNRVTEVDVRVARSLLQNAEKQGIAEIPEGMAPQVRVHVESLFSTNPAVRAQAVEKLGAMGHRAQVAAPFVTANVLRGESGKKLPTTVVSVFTSPAGTAVELEKLGIPALKPLIEHLKQQGGPSVGVDVTAPGIGSGNLLVGRLIDRLKHPNANVRQRAARLLGTMNNPRAVDPLIEALSDSDARVRDNAAESLKRLTGEDFGTDQQKWQQWRGEKRQGSEL